MEVKRDGCSLYGRHLIMFKSKEGNQGANSVVGETSYFESGIRAHTARTKAHWGVHTEDGLAG